MLSVSQSGNSAVQPTGMSHKYVPFSPVLLGWARLGTMRVSDPLPPPTPAPMHHGIAMGDMGGTSDNVQLAFLTLIYGVRFHDLLRCLEYWNLRLCSALA